MQFFDRLKGALESVGGAATSAVLTLLEPEVHEEISERVNNFQANALQALPDTCETSVRENSGSNAVAWAVDKALGDNTSELVSKLVELMRPGITDATSGLSTQATDLIMARVRSALSGNDDDETAQAQDQQAAGGADGQPSTWSLDRAVGLVMNLDERLPEVEASARQQAHPLFVQLQERVWALVPATLQQALGDVLDRNKGAVEEQAQGGEGGGLRGLLSGGKDALVDWLQTSSGPALERGVDALTGLLEGPVKAVIVRLVNELEEGSLSAAFVCVRHQLAAYHLIKEEGIAAQP